MNLVIEIIRIIPNRNLFKVDAKEGVIRGGSLFQFDLL